MAGRFAPKPHGRRCYNLLIKWGGRRLTSQAIGALNLFLIVAVVAVVTFVTVQQCDTNTEVHGFQAQISSSDSEATSVSDHHRADSTNERAAAVSVQRCTVRVSFCPD